MAWPAPDNGRFTSRSGAGTTSSWPLVHRTSACRPSMRPGSALAITAMINGALPPIDTTAFRADRFSIDRKAASRARTIAVRVSLNGVGIPCRSPSTGTMPLTRRFRMSCRQDDQDAVTGWVGHQRREVGDIAFMSSNEKLTPSATPHAPRARNQAPPPMPRHRHQRPLGKGCAWALSVTLQTNFSQISCVMSSNARAVNPASCHSDSSLARGGNAAVDLCQGGSGYGQDRPGPASR